MGSGAMTPIGGAGDLFGLWDMVFGEVFKSSDSDGAKLAAALIFRGKAGGGAAGILRSASLVKNAVAKSAANGDRLTQHLYQLEKYGQAGFKQLQNGANRYYGTITPASKSGTMIGRRVVREWNPFTNTKRIWMETLDNSGNIRIVRPQFGNIKGAHYEFDQFGNYIGSW